MDFLLKTVYNGLISKRKDDPHVGELIPLSLSLLICLSLLPGQAGATDAPKSGHPVQAEDMEIQDLSKDSAGNTNPGVADPCGPVRPDVGDNGGAGGLGAGDTYGNGNPWGGSIGGGKP